MKNKTLSRIFKKTMNIRSDEEYLGLLQNLKKSADLDPSLSSFSDNFDGFITMIASTFDGLDKILDIRDRSLAVSSAELTALNEEISKVNKEQEEALDTLKKTVNVLDKKDAYKTDTDKKETNKRSTKESGADNDSVKSEADQSQKDDRKLSELVSVVEKLVESQLNASNTLQLVFEESQKISSSINLKSFSDQLVSSIEKITGRVFPIYVFISGRFFEGSDESNFYQVLNSHSQSRGKSYDEVMENKKTFLISVDSPKGKLAIIAIGRSIENLVIENWEEVREKINTLLPIISTTLENIQHLRNEKIKLQIENELQTARLVQQTLLPTDQFLKPGLEITGHFQSATECGGDWWTHFPLNGKHIVLVGDVTGHGTGSAMVSAVVKGYCDSLVHRESLTMSQLLSELNIVVYRMAKVGGRLMTMAAVSIDLEKSEIEFSNAGHPHPILIFQDDKSKQTAKYLVASGPALGQTPDSEFNTKNFSFKKGETLYFYTDGITECLNRENELFGDSRLFRFLSRQEISSMAGLNNQILKELKKFRSGEQLHDDITSVLVCHSI